MSPVINEDRHEKIVRLEAEERRQFDQFVLLPKAAAYNIRHPNLLFAGDHSHQPPASNHQHLSPALGGTVRSIEMLRRRFVP